MAEAAKKLSEVPSKKEGTSKEGGVSAQAPQKKDWIGILSLMVVAINLGAVGGLGFYLNKAWTKMVEMDMRISQVAAAQKEDAAPTPKQLSGRSLTPPTPGTLYPLESFLVNITSDQGPKFLQTQMEFELTDAATEDEITKKKAAIRDAIIVLLSSRSYKQIRETTGMLNLRRDILRSVNNLLTSGQIREVYFTQFHFN